MVAEIDGAGFLTRCYLDDRDSVAALALVGHPQHAVIRDIEKAAVRRESHLMGKGAYHDFAGPPAILGIKSHLAGLFLHHRQGGLRYQRDACQQGCEDQCKPRESHQSILYQTALPLSAAWRKINGKCENPRSEERRVGKERRE